MTPIVRCWLESDQSSHEGSGGGFSVVRFHHLHVENHSSTTLTSVQVRYRLMKGTNCFQEDVLVVEQVKPGTTGRSKSFIRDSQLFDRIEWVGDVVVEADPPVPRDAVTFTGTLPGASSRLWIILGAGVLLAAALWLVFKT